MLKAMRRAVSGWTAKILLTLLIGSFAVWGIGDVFRGRTAASVLTAGDISVSPRDYALAYDRAMAGVARQLGRRPSAEEAQMFGLDQSVVSQLVSGAVLDNQGENIGLGLSQDRLARLIAKDPTFHDATGNFSRTAFRNVLANAGMSESDYIATEEKAAVRAQLVDAVSNDAETPKVFATALGLYNGERRTIDYFRLTPDIIPPVSDPSAEDLQTFFQSHKSEYAAPEYRAINYAIVSPEALSDPSAIGEAEVKAYYEAHQDRYTTPETRDVQQIVFDDMDGAKAAETAIKNGGSFEDAATKAGRNVSDTQLGMVSKSGIPDQKIADAAFSLNEGAVSDVVQGAFGPAILRVTKIEPADVKPLGSVEDEIRKELALQAASEVSANAYNTFEDARASGATFHEAAQQAGVAMKSVPSVDARGTAPDGKQVPDLPAEQELLQAAFSTDPGADNMPINAQQGTYVFYEVVSIDPAHERKLDDVRARVVGDWKKNETSRLLDQKAKDLKKQIETGLPLQQAAASVGAEPQTAEAITRQSGAAELGQPATLAAFSGAQGTVSSASGPGADSLIVLKVAEVSPPADPDGSVSTSQRQQISDMLQNDLLQSYVMMLQNNTQISIHPAGIEQAKALIR